MQGGSLPDEVYWDIQNRLNMMEWDSSQGNVVWDITAIQRFSVTSGFFNSIKTKIEIALFTIQNCSFPFLFSSSVVNRVQLAFLSQSNNQFPSTPPLDTSVDQYIFFIIKEELASMRTCIFG